MDTHRLRISVSNMKNANTREELELIKATVLKNLSDLDAAPSAQLAPRPPAFVKVGRVPSSLLHSPMPNCRPLSAGITMQVHMFGVECWHALLSPLVMHASALP